LNRVFADTIKVKDLHCIFIGEKSGRFETHKHRQDPKCMCPQAKEHQKSPEAGRKAWKAILPQNLQKKPTLSTT